MKRWRFARDHRWSQEHMSEYIDAELRPDASERIEHHLRDCPECRALLASLHAVLSTLAALPGEPSRAIASTVLAGVQRELAKGDEQLG